MAAKLKQHASAREQRVTRHHEQLRAQYPELHGKVVDFIHHGVEDGGLYFTVRFEDKTQFSVRYRCEMVLTGASLYDATTGNLRIVRQYFKPKDKE